MQLRVNTIKLIYKKGHRYVKIVDFVGVSQLIKQHQVTGRVPRSIDLTDYFDSTITIFADYIEKGEVKAQISFYSLAELLKLTKTFVMEELQKRLEEILVLTAETSTENLIQAVLVAGTSNITKETESALHYLAAWSFVEMAKLPDFQRIPYHQFVMLLASCELHISHELVAADAALLWLVGQPHPAIYAPGVFSVIRSAYLSKVDRQLIIERIATLQMPESVARFARISMESRHSLRICLEGIHISRHLCRCGIPDPENRPKETTLSLSRPREGIKWSEKNKTNIDVTAQKRNVRADIVRNEGMSRKERYVGRARDRLAAVSDRGVGTRMGMTGKAEEKEEVVARVEAMEVVTAAEDEKGMTRSARAAKDRREKNADQNSDVVGEQKGKEKKAQGKHERTSTSHVHVFTYLNFAAARSPREKLQKAITEQRRVRGAPKNIVDEATDTA
ncbi:hypothetical protein NECAME_01665 [Necator americanus]|uniref:BACK domain-containing protein n=1 Tax=Necator americanus TaxID=51031 RepID=W2TRK7_NECAM|nr:hypothetical protein NECAME_01665 [Necator americanus]ETN84438.1 hypothetical protein NECAME_01665 [Necator americanus]